mmetsp:Transcript_27094/g.62684  ORF Transcript_27094/g.62684 Transcript_27094/m.62684 type:complete len:334 (-) Transcript_27094:136-1137(-)
MLAWRGFHSLFAAFTLATALQQHSRSGASSGRRPIWSYWSNGSPPPLVRLCLQSIEAHAGSQWELHTLTPDTAKDYVNAADLPKAFEEMQPSFQADALRLALLRRHGGTWIDASSIILRDLASWVDKPLASGKDFVGFYIDHYTAVGEPPLVASWAVAVREPEQEVLVAWHNAYLQLWENRTTEDGISDDKFFAGIDISGVDPLMQDYLNIELVLQAILQRDPALQQDFMEHSLLLRSEDTAYGLQATLGLTWMAQSKCAPVDNLYELLPVAARHAMEVTPLVKLRHQDRVWLATMSATTLLRKSDSVLGALFMKSNLQLPDGADDGSDDECS